MNFLDPNERLEQFINISQVFGRGNWLLVILPRINYSPLSEPVGKLGRKSIFHLFIQFQ